MPDLDSGDPSTADGQRSVLRADCERCVGLCCVAPAFAASADFAIDKPAGRPCPNLEADFRCGIHSSLRALGFPGCVAYDCFGAGQRVTQEASGGADWRAHPDSASRMFAAFFVVRQLHELLWYLTEALAHPEMGLLRPELRQIHRETEGIANGGQDAWGALDLAGLRGHVSAVLRRASALARAGSPGPALDRRGADLIEADLRTVDLRGADLRGALLVGADLRDARLDLADLTGADLRGADLAGADLAGTLFLTQSQLESARGDGSTVLPGVVRRPAHWQ